MTVVLVLVVVVVVVVVVGNACHRSFSSALVKTVYFHVLFGWWPWLLRREGAYTER